MTIALLIRSLHVGGAERQAVAIADGLRKRGHDVHVIVFYGGGALERSLHGTGVDVHSVLKKGRWDVFGFLLRLGRLMRRVQPDSLYTFLPIENIVGLMIKVLFPRMRLVWSIRSSFVDFTQYDWLSRVAYGLQSRLHGLAQGIVVNSHEGQRHAVRRGIKSERLTVIPNGMDVTRFHPDAVAGAELRADWNVQSNEILIGLVARLDPMKGHEVFIKAAALLSNQTSSLRFVIVGRNKGPSTAYLVSLVAELGLADRMIWAGEILDIVPVYNALDLLISSSSWGEGFSNVIAEAMSCETPCVVTDVGDSALIVGETGIAVPPADPAAITRGALDLLSQDLNTLGRKARERIVEHFSMEVMVRSTEKILTNETISNG